MPHSLTVFMMCDHQALGIALTARPTKRYLYNENISLHGEPAKEVSYLNAIRLTLLEPNQVLQ